MRLKSLLLAIMLAAGCPFNISAQEPASSTSTESGTAATIANAHKIAGVMANTQ